MEVTFHNPEVGDDKGWTHGFFLTAPGPNFFHAVFIHRTGNWRHSYRLGPEEKWTTLHQDVTSAVDTNPGGLNHLRLVIFGQQG